MTMKPDQERLSEQARKLAEIKLRWSRSFMADVDGENPTRTQARKDTEWLARQLTEAERENGRLRRIEQAVIRMRDEPRKADEPEDQAWVEVLEALDTGGSEG